MGQFLSFRDKLSAEGATGVYYIPGKDTCGRSVYMYVMIAAALRDDFLQQLSQGIVPRYGVMLAHGEGEPSSEIKDRMKRYYGFDHDVEKVAA